MQETGVLSLGWDDPLVKGMATHPSILPGESHGQRSLAGYSPRGCKESDTTEQLTHTLITSLEKTLMLGKTEGQRRRGQPRMRCLDSMSDSMDMNLSKLWEIVKDRGPWRATVHGVEKSQTRLSNQTITT